MAPEHTPANDELREWQELLEAPTFTDLEALAAAHPPLPVGDERFSATIDALRPILASVVGSNFSSDIDICRMSDTAFEYLCTDLRAAGDLSRTDSGKIAILIMRETPEEGAPDRFSLEIIPHEENPELGALFRDAVRKYFGR